MFRSIRVVRWASALTLAGGLAVQVATNAPVASGFDLSKAPPLVRGKISTTAEMALGGGPAETPRPANYFPASDECQVNFGSNLKVNQNCLNVSDPKLQGRAQAQNETSIAVDPHNPQH